MGYFVIAKTKWRLDGGYLLPDAARYCLTTSVNEAWQGFGVRYFLLYLASRLVYLCELREEKGLLLVKQ